jgi:hypothetical protein
MPLLTSTVAGAVLAGLMILFQTSALADALESAIETRVETQMEGVASQERVDALADEAQRLLQEYRSVLAQAESLRLYREQLERLVANQEQELASLGRQLEGIEITQRRIVPLMLRMVDVLEQFVALDLPFLSQERALRVASLRELMDRPDVSLAEKYRRVLESYQVEVEYGRTIEAYQGPLSDGEGRTVDFLRVGRVALFYRSFDGREVGRWDPVTEDWQALPAEYASAVQQGLRIARKEVPPDLMRLPIHAPEVRP